MDWGVGGSSIARAAKLGASGRISAPGCRGAQELRTSLVWPGRHAHALPAGRERAQHEECIAGRVPSIGQRAPQLLGTASHPPFSWCRMEVLKRGTLGLLVLTACQPERTPLELSESRLVVHAMLQAGADTVRVSVSRTKPNP